MPPPPRGSVTELSLQPLSAPTPNPTIATKLRRVKLDIGTRAVSCTHTVRRTRPRAVPCAFHVPVIGSCEVSHTARRECRLCSIRPRLEPTFLFLTARWLRRKASSHEPQP